MAVRPEHETAVFEEQDWSNGDSSELVWLSDLSKRQLLYREEQDWSSGDSSELFCLSDLNPGKLLHREEQECSRLDHGEQLRAIWLSDLNI